MNSLMHTLEILVHWVNSILWQNPGAFLVIASFIAVNVLMYFLTRGREFAITGYAGVLFLLPFVKFIW